jgi:predicted enzyme related to lactoylglutathione lyase
MAKVVGIGGVFLRAKNPEALYAWYAQKLGIPRSSDGSFMFEDEASQGMTVFAFFPQTTQYFGPGTQATMINFRVDDLDGLLKKLVADGVTVDPNSQDYDYGKFGWIVDPEGNRVELWEPKAPEESVKS